MLAYFSASSNFLDKNKDLYIRIIKIISTSGYSLTSNWVNDKTKLNPEQLFEQATSAIKKSNILIAEITNPSTGVGQQISLALSQKIPVIILIRSDIEHEPRFTFGTKSPYIKIVKYDSSSLEYGLKKNLNNIKKNKYVKFNFVTTREINNFLEETSKEKNISKSEFLRKIIEYWKNKNN